jgi:hypothetical protein
MGRTKGTNSNSWTLGLKYQMLEKANTIPDCLENQFKPHDLCEKKINGGGRVARFQELHEAADDTPWRK